MDKEKTAFELLFNGMTEINSILEKTDKNAAVKRIKTEFTEFKGLSDNTVRTNITVFKQCVSEITVGKYGTEKQSV